MNSLPKCDALEAYLNFDRSKWAALRNNVELTLSESDLKQLQGINEKLSLEEVVDIYLPLSRLLSLHVESQQSRNVICDSFLGTEQPVKPFIIGIAGSVAVGKSTVARILQALLSHWKRHPKVTLITTDGFLYSNKHLITRNLMHKKGFPESFDTKGLIDFVAKIKAGDSPIFAPIYSHITYDILPDEQLEVTNPDIVILEGLNVLQTATDTPNGHSSLFVSDFVDFSIYVDADDSLLEQWYIDRFMKFREGAFTDPNAYFHCYSKMSKTEAIERARKIWRQINAVNLHENIKPTRDRANLVLQKALNHQVENIKLRK
ncbi:MAG TPA: type I pantothenate kinase [Psychromonas hadalis]|nr:type I pantothenate kinase [Psychromonas hadalis]